MPEKEEKNVHPERARLLRAFDEGGAVLLDGRLLGSKGDVPDSEEFEKRDERASQAAGSRLLARRDALDAQIARLPHAQQRMVSQTSPNVGIGNQSAPPDVPLDEVYKSSGGGGGGGGNGGAKKGEGK